MRCERISFVVEVSSSLIGFLPQSAAGGVHIAWLPARQPAKAASRQPRAACVSHCGRTSKGVAIYTGMDSS